MRRHRMRGQRTKWILGTDHAGIATQTQVERRWSPRAPAASSSAARRSWSGCGVARAVRRRRSSSSSSASAPRATTTTSASRWTTHYADAVARVFVALYEKGYIYRDRYMVNWDPGSRLGDLRPRGRGRARSPTRCTTSTTRSPPAIGRRSPSRRFGPRRCSPTPRSRSIPTTSATDSSSGETAILPLVGRELPIIADEYVKPEFGTGALKITPGHDPNDFEIGRRHGLEQISVIGEDGRITAEAPERFRGLPVARGAARGARRSCAPRAPVRRGALQAQVPFSQRSGERIEPLVSLQWFMRMDELAEPAIEVVRDGRVRFHPTSYTRVYMDWMENIRPWVHLPPAVVGPPDCRSGTATARRPTWASSAPEGEGWERDPDVLDTWFSSALWPFATLGWPEQTPELRAFYPTDALVTAGTSSSSGSRG